MNTMSAVTEQLLDRPDVRVAIRLLVEGRAPQVTLRDGLTLRVWGSSNEGGKGT